MKNALGRGTFGTGCVLCVFVGAWFFGSQPASVRADIRAADFLAQEKQSIHSSGHESPGALAQNARAEKANPRARAAVQQFMAGPSVFIENAGQWADGSIRFALDGSGANVGLTDQGPRFQLFRKTSTTSTTFTPSTPGQALEKSAPAPTEMHEFAVVFDGAARVAPAGRGKSDRTFNYLMGDVTNHREGVSSFNSVWYEGLYPGVSLELTGSRTGIKYNFHVAPGADWRAIRVKYDGVEGLSLRPDGALEIRIAEGWDALADAAPYIYQEVNGEKVTVAGRFVLFHGHTYGFEVTGACDSSLPLIIDPAVAWGTYLGGTNNDYGRGIAVDSSGNVYATGDTECTGWVSGGWDTTFGTGPNDGYVVKLSAAGAHLWSTYLGGAGFDEGRSIAVDSSGNVYATGLTASSGWVSGGWDTTYNGDDRDGYVVKLSAAGAHLWSTYLGGTDRDYGLGIAVDSSGNAYVTGQTASEGWVSGGWDTSVNGGWESYVVKLSPTGAHLWSTYLGGTGNDYGGYGIAVDSSGNVYVTGWTDSGGWVSGGWDTSYAGACDGYVVKLSTSGAHVWSTYLGGTGYDDGWGIAVDSSGNAYVTGSTYSSGWVSGGWDTILNGEGSTTYSDGYVVKLSTSGAHVWSTYLGGTGNDCGYGIAVDSSGNAYATGSTGSSGWVSGGWNTTSGSGYVVKLSTAGAHRWSSYLGGTGFDYGQGIAVDSSGNVYATGFTNSSGWVSGGWDTSYNGGLDGFVVSISQLLDLAVPPSNPGVVALATGSITWTWQDNSDTETGFSVWVDLGAGPPITLQTTTAADVTSWQHTGLSVNTRYAFQVAAANANGDSVRTPNYTAYTEIEPVSGVVFSGVGSTSISVASVNVPSNLASDLSGLSLINASTGANSGWLKSNTLWASVSLAPNTPYLFTGMSRNGDGIQTTPPPGVAKYTLAATPVAPVVTVPSVHVNAIHALDLVIGPGDGNPASTRYAIQVAPAVSGNAWIQAGGTVGATPVFRMAAAWDAKRVTGLAKATTYTFTAIARNGEDIDTAFGPGASATTADNLPPSAPVLSFPTVQSDIANLVCAIVIPSTDPEGDRILYEFDWYVKRQSESGFSLFRNDAPDAVTSSQVNNTDTEPRDVWYCVVTPHDEEEGGAPAATAECAIVLGGVIPSYISLGATPLTVALGEAVTALGQIFPTPAGSGTVSFHSVSPSGVGSDLFPEGTVFAAGSYLKLLYPTEASAGRAAWSVTASWSGDAIYQAATSAPVMFTVLKCQPSLAVSLSASCAPMGYAELEATAVLNAAVPANLRPLLSGRLVNLWLKKPDASSAGPVVGVTGEGSEAVFLPSSFVSAGIAFDTPGVWQFIAAFEGDNNFLPATSTGYDQPGSTCLTVKDRAGYAVIVVGQFDTSSEGQAEHQKTSDYVYDAFYRRGFAHEDIWYLRHGQPPVGRSIQVDDASPNKSDLEYAIMTWAKNKMNGSPGPLYVVLLDHGGENAFYMYAGSYDTRTVTPIDLKASLDTLQANLSSTAASEDLVVIYGACHSGSFIDAVSGPNRTIITSASPDEVSHRGVVDPDDGLRDGEAFTTELFRYAQEGKTLKESFELASAKLSEYTATRSNNGTAEHTQHPLLDDNGDGLGTVAGALSYTAGEDGSRAHELMLGYGVNAGASVGWMTVTPTRWLDPDAPVPMLEGRADTVPATGDEAWIEVKKPSYEGSHTIDESNPDSQQEVLMDVFDYEPPISDPEHGYFRWQTFETTFDAPGTYQVFYYIRDHATGVVSTHMLTTIYRRTTTNHPPQSVDLVYPGNGATVYTSTFFAWEETTDPDGDPVTYRLEVAENPGFTEGLLVNEGLLTTVAQMPGLEDLHTYYWRVIPVDVYGATPASNAVRALTTDNGNETIPGNIMGVVKDTAGRAIAGATVSVGAQSATTSTRGVYFLADLDPRGYTVLASASNYESKTQAATVSAGATKNVDFELTPAGMFRWGDLNGDGKAATLDTSLILQALAFGDPDEPFYFPIDAAHQYPYKGVMVPLPPYPPADVSGDAQLGTNDAREILKMRVGRILHFPADTTQPYDFGPEGKANDKWPLPTAAVHPSVEPGAKCAGAATRTVTLVKTAAAESEDELTVALALDDASGVLGCVAEIDYDASTLEYEGVSGGALLSEGGQVVAHAEDGHISVAGAVLEALTGGGELVVFHFRQITVAPCDPCVQIELIELNDSEMRAVVSAPLEK